MGGILTSLFNTVSKRFRREPAPGETVLPEDMSTMSLVGGGLIAGESLFYLFVGLAGLLSLLG
jgi:hypothetical protein